MNSKKNPACIYCKNQKTDFFLKSDNFSYFRCKDCGLVFLSPQLRTKNISLLNKEMYGKRNKISEYFKREKYYRDVAVSIIKQIKKYQKKGKLLDVGCSYGLFLEEARKAGFEVYGLEMEKETADFAKKKFNLEIIDTNFENFENGQYDVITFIDVLEHLPNLKKVLLKVSKMLKKDGILFIQYPNIESLAFRLTKEKWNWFLPGIHLYQFSTVSLKKILEENSFNILSIRTCDDISEFAYNLIDVLGIKKKSILAKVFWKFLRMFFLIVLQLSFVWCYFGYGGSINIIAGKNNH